MMRPLPPKIAKVLEQPAAFTPCRNYKIETTLGHGGHGAVFLARHIASHRLIAVKMTEVDENTFAEVAMLKQCSHDNILRV